MFLLKLPCIEKECITTDTQCVYRDTLFRENMSNLRLTP